MEGGASERLVKHARYYWLFLAEGHLNRRRFGAMLGRIVLLSVPTGYNGCRFRGQKENSKLNIFVLLCRDGYHIGK